VELGLDSNFSNLRFFEFNYVEKVPSLLACVVVNDGCVKEGGHSW
jgi:hypothetical protein